MRAYVFIGLLLTLALACTDEATSNSGRSVKETPAKEGGRIADIIRNPVTANEPLDTINVAKMVFSETSHQFGKVKAGETVKHTFKFTNPGKIPLLITNAKSTCGCTVPEWPDEPIEPGGTGEIQVKFNTKNRKDYQSKPVTITANTYPSQTILYMKGHVISDKE